MVNLYSIKRKIEKGDIMGKRLGVKLREAGHDGRAGDKEKKYTCLDSEVFGKINTVGQ